MKRRWFPAAGAALLCLFLWGGALAEDMSVAARAAVLIDGATGRALFAQNADRRYPMASTTKIMTALLALERCSLEETVTASANASGVPGTSIYLGVGESLSMRDMLLGLMLRSGNDAAVAIAEHVGGSVEDFCRMMTQRARELGCENTVFLTPHGLPVNGHFTTARDLVLIARQAMKQPLFREIVSTQRASLPWAGHDYDRVLVNKNKLLSTYPGALGVKTGYTRAAGRCLVFAAERDGMTLIGAVLNCPDWFDAAAALLDQGFDNWKMARVLDRGDTVRLIPVQGGTAATVRAVAAEDVKAPVRKDGWPELVLNLPDTLDAGIQAGDVLGTAELIDGGQIVARVPLVAADAVPRQSFRSGWLRLFRCWPLLSK